MFNYAFRIDLVPHVKVTFIDLISSEIYRNFNTLTQTLIQEDNLAILLKLYVHDLFESYVVFWDKRKKSLGIFLLVKYF